MTAQERTFLLSWLVNEDIRLHDECAQMRSNLRYRRIDTVDCFEFALTLQRYEDFRQYASIIRRLLKIER